MNNSAVTFDDLPDEILLVILSKLHHIDILCSMVGVSERLDKIACDVYITRSLDLIMNASIDEDNTITDATFNRLCAQILPRICHKIEYLTIEGDLFQRVLYVNTYPNLHTLNIVNLPLNIASKIFFWYVFVSLNFMK